MHQTVSVEERLRTLGTQLSQLAGQRAEQLFNKLAAECNLADIEFRLLAEGVPGKNESERTAARQYILNADDEWVNETNNLQSAKFGLVRIDGQIAVYEALRRAEEWCIRARLSDKGNDAADEMGLIYNVNE